MTTDHDARYLDARRQLEALVWWLDQHGDDPAFVKWLQAYVTRLSRAVQERKG